MVHGQSVWQGTEQFMCEELAGKCMWALVETCGPPNACWEDIPRTDSPAPGTRFTKTHRPASIFTGPCASPKSLLLFFSYLSVTRRRKKKREGDGGKKKRRKEGRKDDKKSIATQMPCHVNLPVTQTPSPRF